VPCRTAAKTRRICVSGATSASWFFVPLQILLLGCPIATSLLQNQRKRHYITLTTTE
jgi:hypothetical protein